MTVKELIERMKKEHPAYASHFHESSEHGDKVTFIAFIGHYKPDYEPCAVRCLEAVRSVVGPEIHSYIHYDKESTHTGVSVILRDYYGLN
jgi:hypothetical protein